MKKRVAATFLWFYAGWYAGALLAEFLGVSALIGPVIGAAAAGMFAGDPFRVIWTAKAATPEPAATSAFASTTEPV
jgi:hypothetical protein